MGLQYRPQQDPKQHQRDAQPDKPVPDERPAPLVVVRGRDEKARDQKEKTHEERLADDHHEIQDHPRAILRRLGVVPDRDVAIGHRGVDDDHEHGQQNVQVVEVQ